VVFVDTSHVYALIDRLDGRHHVAEALSERVRERGLLTTNHVLGESWTLTNRRLGHSAACEVVAAIRQSRRYTVVHVDSDAEKRAFEWLLRHDEREYSFVDATSFETMRGLGIREALAFDQDFEAAGFRTLRA
jgi:predicted nucleic acid-binding protein